MRARAWLLLACAAWCAGPGPPPARAAPPAPAAAPPALVTLADTSRLHFRHGLYNVSIPENSPPRSYVTQSVGEDPLGVHLPPTSTRCRFRLKHGDRDKFFKAEERTLGDFCFLLLRTRAAADVLNRERRDHFQLSVRATVNLADGQILDADTTISVVVTDVNDLSPLFYPTDYEATVREDASLHSSIIRITAEDADLGLNGEIYYSLAKADERFAVHPTTGVVTLTRPLVGAPSSIEVVLLASDRASLLTLGEKAPSARASLVVHVQRVNFNAPELRVQHQRELVVDESGAGDVYAVVEGSDRDVGDYVSDLDIVDGDPDGHFRVRTAGPSRWLVAAHALLADSAAPRAYNLTLRARDAGHPPRLSYVTLPVTITPSTRAAPIFSREVYEASVAEWAPPRTPLVRLKVEERDATADAHVYIEIVGGNEGGEFTVDAESGVLYTAQTLDAERRSLYTLTVSAVDHGSTGTRHQSSAKVKITVVDCNDNDPIFERDDIDVSIAENGPSGEVVARLVARDADSGENAYISYSIVNSAPVPFEVDHFSGVVRTTRVIDYESMRREYIVRVRASDWGLPFRRQAEAKLTVRVRDVNDNRPQFERVDCVGYVPRKLPISSPLLTLSALDYDAGDVVAYRISAGNEDGCFALDSSTGVLSVACELSDIRTDVRVLNVTATDGTHFADDSSLTLHLAAGGAPGALECRDTGAARRLAALLAAAERANAPDLTDTSPAARLDDNLHTPDFVDFPVEIKVNESVALGTTLVRIHAHDRDPGYNGLLAFAISSGDINSVFRIDPDTGELQVIGYLDRESEEEYYLNITVTDLGQPPRARSRLLPVTVLDVNDNAPMFERVLASLRVTENALNGTIVFRANATDRDAGQFGHVTYSLIGGGTDFCVERDTGIVRVCGALDRERCALYELAVRATDGGGRSTDAAVRVAVDDVNDEAPRWGPAVPPVRVPEDIPVGALIAALSATDPDLNAAGTVTYSLPDNGPDEDTFTIDSISGVLRTTKPLDFEQRQVYGVRVRATDGGQPALWSDTTLLVEVTDVDENAHAPTFAERAILAKVREDAPPGAAVARVQASDADPPGRDSRLAYYILDGDGLSHFTIDDTGEIHTLTPLDRETRDHYWLTVCAHDHGLIPRHTCIQVYIEVQDVNDMAPWPERAAYFAAVEEHCPGGTHVATVRADDADSTPTNITYSIVAGNPDGLFSIDESSGEIVTTGRVLDREATASHALEVACSDGELSTSARVTVAVLDINDHAPAFTQRYYDIRVPLPVDYTDDLQSDSAAGEENSVESDDEGDSDDEDSRWDSFDHTEDSMQFYVTTVAALDGDAAENGTVQYSARARPARAVRVNALTGQLWASRPVRTPVTLTVRACDSGTKPRCSVSRARVRGVAAGGGAAPQLAAPPALTAAELDAPGFLLHVLQASDPDGDPLYYRILDGDPRQEFYIGREDGSIILSKRLLWERTPQYSLNVSVTDGLHIVTTIVNVTVINDVNEGGVQFEQEQYSVEVAEGAAEGEAGGGVGIALLVLRARVAGAAPLLYGVAAARAPASGKLFRLQERAAVLQLARPLDWESARTHELTVWARDQAPRASLAFARVLVHVIPRDEHAPHWGRRLAEARLPPHAPRGTLVSQLRAADRDGDPVAYSLRGGSGLFAVDDTGAVTLLRDLPDDAREFALSVRATGPPPAARASTLPLHVLVADASTGPPRFTEPELICEMPENEPSGTVIGALELRGGGAGARFALSGTGSELFSVGLTSGAVATAAPLDYERQNFYNLTVTAYDMAGRTTKAHVIVHVVDRNEFPPTLTQREYTGQVSEAAGAGAAVSTARGGPLVLAARDLDGPAQRRAEYRIAPPAAAACFRIHPTTGAVTLAAPLNYEEASEHVFTVTVLDAGTPRMPVAAASSATVRVRVLDEDDTAPHFVDPPTTAVVLLPTIDNALVATLTAVDPDTAAESLSYDIMEGDASGVFTVSSRGEVRVKRAGAVAARAKLRVRVSDGRRAATTRLDVTARAPLAAGLAFHKAEYFASVVENSTRVVTVAVLAVLGAALNEHVHFAILNPTDEFKIGKTSGAVSTTGLALDRERVSSFTLQVVARSGSGEAAREALATLTVSVADVNDNCPVFVGRPYVAAARAGDPPGVLLTVHARDADAGDNADVRYEMKRGHGELFRVDRRTGEVALRQPLDARDEPYTLLVAAFDGGVPACGAEASVAVRVWAGGAAPRWEQAAAQLEASEADTSLPALPRAISPLNRPLIYTLLPTPDAELFRLAYDTGTLEAREALDYETRPELHVVVRAADSVSGAHADLPVTLRLRDYNDNSPRFTTALRTADVSEAAPVGYLVAILNATDKDSGENAKITYSLWSADPSSLALFSIDGDSGAVRVAAALDRETSARHRLVVTARDEGRPSRAASARLLVNVGDVNDCAPQLERSVISVSVSTEAARGLAVARVPAWDPDDGDKLTWNLEGDAAGVEVDSKTGEVRVRRRLPSARSVNVSVSDGARAGWARLRLVPAPHDAAPPAFPHLVHEARAAENQPPPLLVTTVKAFDTDPGEYGTITYSLPSAKHREIFSIDPSTAALSTRVPLDRETKALWEVCVVATDGGGLVRAGAVRVAVADDNDHAPQFPLREYVASARPRRAAPFLRVEARDKDAESRLSYALLAPPGSHAAKALRVDALSGDVALTADAAAYEGSVIQAWVVARDSGGRTGEAPLRVLITKAGPAAAGAGESGIQLPRELRISEDATVGTRLASLLPASASSPPRLRLAAAADDHPQPFDIQDGNLVLSGSLDRETCDRYVVGVIAEGAGGAAVMAISRVIVLDVNEHAPAFHSQPYVLSVAENAPLYSTLLQLQADDPDEGPNGEVLFSLSPDAESEVARTFAVDDAGWVSTRALLDREARAEWRLPLVARDAGTPSRSSRGSLLLRVLDVNDEPPRLAPRELAADVPEDAPPGTLVARLTALDADAVRAPLWFWIAAGDDRARFSLRGPELLLARPLDREQKDNYQLRVAASDGKFTAYAVVRIAVGDVNDNPPECEQTHIEHELSEDAPIGTTVDTLRIFDEDLPHNARVRYFLTGDDHQHFAINQESGVISVASALDRETRASYSLRALAADRAHPEWNCSVELSVSLRDVNDNEPSFSARTYSATLPEDADVGTLVAKVHATDPDGGAAGTVRYSASANGVFALDADSGVVTLRAPLDRETAAEHRLVVTARDAGQPPRSATATLRLTVADVNDNPPEFETREYRAVVPELAEPGAELLRVRAASRDTGLNAEVHYELLAGDARADFSLDRESGALLVARPLDFERRRDYLLTVQAIDAGDPPLNDVATVNITVLDANDNAPVFSQAAYSARVREDSAPGERVVQVIADDSDSGANGRVTYSILRGDPNGHFAIDADTGYVSVAAALDRETVASFSLTLRARDRGVPSLDATVPLTIDVLDANDNPPLFSSSNYSVVVREDRPLGTAVLRLAVTDADAAPNGAPFTFDLQSGNEAGAFRVEADGTLRTAARYNHRVRDRYALQLRVFDNGAPPLYSDATVHVRVVQESQYPPVVTPLDAALVSYRDEFPGGAAGRVHAADRDQYDTLTFSLAPHDAAADLFFIDAATGELRAAPRLDPGEYRLNVTVDDGKFVGSATVRVTVVLVTDETLAQAIVVRFREVTDRDFILGHRKGFLRAVAEATDCEPTDVVIVSVQPSGEGDEDNRQKRQVAQDLDVAFAVRGAGGYLPADVLRRRLHAHLERLEERTRLVVEELLRAACGGCVHGACTERVQLLEDRMRVVATDVFSLVAPAHRLLAACSCEAGWAGERCEERAAAATVPIVYFGGDGYLQFRAARGAVAGRRVPDDELELALRLRTRRPRGTILAAAGLLEYGTLEVIDGHVQFRMDVGAGEVALRAGGAVDDGEWHDVRLERRGAAVRLTVDRRAAAALAPPPDAVLDAPHDRLLLGAQLEHHDAPDGLEQITYGFEGCMSDIRLGEEALPLEERETSSGVALLKKVRTRVSSSCPELRAPDACAAHPCQHGGTCRALEGGGFACSCHARFAGSQCERDTAPCASDPCLHGGTCSAINGSWRCTCGAGLAGARCERGRWCGAGACLHGGACEDGARGATCRCRGYWGPRCEHDVDECAGEPCLNGATCLNEPGSFRCLCPPNKTGMNCGNPLYSDAVVAGGAGAEWGRALRDAWRWAAARWWLLAAATAVLLLLALLPLLLRRRRRAPPPAPPPPVKLSNLAAAARRERPLSSPPLNNVDTLRSYGSAGDELELPPDYIRNLNIDPDRKPWSEQMHLHTFVDNKIYNDLKGAMVAGTRAPLGEPRLVGGYHWDCSDWCGAEPPGLQELPGSERRDSSEPPSPRRVASSPPASPRASPPPDDLRARTLRAPDAASLITMLEERNSLLGDAESECSEFSANLCEIEESDVEESGARHTAV